MCKTTCIQLKNKHQDSTACLPPTNHEVCHTGEDDSGHGPQRDDVRQDLTQEVDRYPVVTADILMTAEREEDIQETC